MTSLLVQVVWCDYRDGNPEIYYKRSTDGGSNWGTDTRLTNNRRYSFHPCIATSGTLVHVVWNDDRDSESKIYYKGSTDGGSSWGLDTRLTNDSLYCGFPSLVASLSNVHIVWYSDQIYYKRSTDNGVTWSTKVQLSNNNLGGSFLPSITVSGSTVHVVWEDYRDGNAEIYYKRNPTGNPIGIIIINSETPKEFSLSQNYPNPFNSETKISFALPVADFVKLTIYDILGCEITTLVNEQLKPGTYEVDWNANKFTSGAYYYKFAAGDYSETKRMILIK